MSLRFNLTPSIRWRSLLSVGLGIWIPSSVNQKLAIQHFRFTSLFSPSLFCDCGWWVFIFFLSAYLLQSWSSEQWRLCVEVVAAYLSLRSYFLWNRNVIRVKRGGIMFKTKTKTPVCLRVSFSLWISYTLLFQDAEALTGFTSGFIIFPSLCWRELSVILQFPDQCHLISMYCQPKHLWTFYCSLKHRFLLQVSLIYSSTHYQLPSFVMANPASLARV